VKEAKVSIKSTDSTSIEHSSSDQECQWRELQNL
jgi:hypothetical protein